MDAVERCGAEQHKTANITKNFLGLKMSVGLVLFFWLFL